MRNLLSIFLIVLHTATTNTMSIWDGTGATNYEAYEKGTPCESWLQAETIKVSMERVDLYEDGSAESRSDFFAKLIEVYTHHSNLMATKGYHNNLLSLDASCQRGPGWCISPYTCAIQEAQKMLLARKLLLADSINAFIIAHTIFKINLVKADEEPLGDTKDLLDHADILLTFAKLCMESCSIFS